MLGCWGAGTAPVGASAGLPQAALGSKGRQDGAGGSVHLPSPRWDALQATFSEKAVLEDDVQPLVCRFSGERGGN